MRRLLVPLLVLDSGACSDDDGDDAIETIGPTSSASDGALEAEVALSAANALVGHLVIETGGDSAPEVRLCRREVLVSEERLHLANGVLGDLFGGGVSECMRRDAVEARLLQPSLSHPRRHERADR